MITQISATRQCADKTCKAWGFTILEMVIVLVMLGLVTSLAFPGLQKMYDSMQASIDRDKIVFALNNLSLDVRETQQSTYFEGYPENTDALPSVFLNRLSELDVKIRAEKPILVTASGFCPESTQLLISNGSRDYQLVLRSPGCHVEYP